MLSFFVYNQAARVLGSFTVFIIPIPNTPVDRHAVGCFPRPGIPEYTRVEIPFARVWSAPARCLALDIPDRWRRLIAEYPNGPWWRIVWNR